MMMKRLTKIMSRQQGQILVVLLLIMVVGLTVGLFLMGRTTVDISLTNKLTDSTRAFNAAEAGIEEAIRDISEADGTRTQLVTGVYYTADTDLAGLGVGNIYPATKPRPTEVGDKFTVWLVPHNENTGKLQESMGNPNYESTTLDVCFSDNDPDPAISVTLFYKTAVGGSYLSSYTGYDPIASRQTINHFRSTVNLSPCPAGYNYRARIDFVNHFGSLPGGRLLLAIRIAPVYASTSIAVMPYDYANDPLPKQGNIITSSGQVGEIVRRITVDDPYLVPAPFMDHAVYSTGETSNIRK